MNLGSAIGGNAIPMSLEIPSGSMTALSAPAISASSFVDSGYRDGHGDEMPHSEINTGFIPQQQPQGHRVSFGSVFLGSDGNENNNGGNRDSLGISQS